ncbi:cysteine proteinase [Backusella circina FSU 941]|nr:cysteine proteinase [Backusella circina FSU 941]
MGVQGIQVEELQTLGRDIIRNLRPVHGFMIIVRRKLEDAFKEDSSLTNHQLYFSNQVIHDAYAMHALLNILLNCTNIDIGPDLTQFKQFTHDFPSTIKGLSISNSSVLRQAYNSLTRPDRYKIPSSEIYHPISIIYSNGYLWELDGFKRSPQKLVPCNDSNWLDVAYIELSKRYEILKKQQLNPSVWTIIEDRRLVFQRKLIGKTYIKSKIENELDSSYPDWRENTDVRQWEEEYHYVMKNERNKRGFNLSNQLKDYCKSFDQLSPSEKQNIQESLVEFTRHGDIMDAWLQIQDDSLRLYECLGLEDEKYKMHERNHLQRQHDYRPFIQAYIKGLIDEGHLKL